MIQPAHLEGKKDLLVSSLSLYNASRLLWTT